MAKRKFYIQTTTGMKFEIDERDYNNLQGRVNRGQILGWYSQRGATMGDVADWQIQMKDIALFYADTPEKTATSRPESAIDITKHKPEKVGARDKPKETEVKCGHNWGDPSSFEFVTQVVSGVNRYYKLCSKCGTKSTLIKKREVEIGMEAQGLTLNDVPLVK